MTAFNQYLQKIEDGAVLSKDEMAASIAAMMDGDATADQMARFLTTLHKRGETADEIAGAAKTMRDRAATISAPNGAIDCCGTGGDGAHTYNISTAVALVAAACGVPIAKHGNRAASSKSGAADVLEQLGITLALSRETLERALRETNFCFLMAPNHHAAMKNIAPVRKTLAHRTLFNLLGPLANPAGTKKQLIGVFDRKWVLPMAHALKSLQSEKAIIVHGSDGLDEITLGGMTYAALLEHGEISELAFTPESFGLPVVTKNQIAGGDAKQNAAALLNLLNGEKTPYRDVVLANAAAVLLLHETRPLKDGVAKAAAAIDSGAALAVLNKYREYTA